MLAKLSQELRQESPHSGSEVRLYAAQEEDPRFQRAKVLKEKRVEQNTQRSRMPSLGIEGSEGGVGVSKRYFLSSQKSAHGRPCRISAKPDPQNLLLPQTIKPPCPEMSHKCHCRSVNGYLGKFVSGGPKPQGRQWTSKLVHLAPGRSLHRGLGQALGSVRTENSCFGLNINNAK